MSEGTFDTCGRTIEFGNLSEDGLLHSNRCTRALILKQDLSSPIDIYLEIDTLKTFKDNIIQNWPSIQQHLSGIDRVYFSPSGELYSTPIENYIEDGRDYIRVSSTREVVLSNERNKETEQSMKLYGGLVYNMTLDDITEVNEKYKREETLRPVNHRSSRDVLTRLGFSYLKETLKEVKDIEQIAKNANAQCELITGIDGTEESLRAVSGKKYSMLHFATHGFYWTQDEAEDKLSDRKFSFLMFENEHPKHVEDKSMTRSGLIFSGANWALNGKDMPEGVEDGIATAQEIARLDLRGCDLVVLSACQTGLGEISGEGVFGLQRGFKKAGVRSILMSLWEVDDLATQMLMTEFYKHYLNGESKTSSLRKAQQYVKSQEGFEDPMYWAGFILLDGLN